MWDLDFWKSDAWAEVNERLQKLERRYSNGHPDPSEPTLCGYCPGRSRLFRALDLIDPGEVRCILIGQDPYPDPKLATGVAFSVPDWVGLRELPPTLRTIRRELSRDTGVSLPAHGSLERWLEEGVLLWNVYPSTDCHRSLAHRWCEWVDLTQQVIRRSTVRSSPVVCLLGREARSLNEFCSSLSLTVIETSHPSPRGSLRSSVPFVGSSLFSRVNTSLSEKGLSPIDWRL